MSAYYNENDPFAAQWLRNLIAAGHIAPGDVDERSIIDVRADDLRGYRQCHFFAGIGGWSLALRLAGYDDDRPVWTGSCPCQPFSAAGRGKAADDERHLWPAWFSLIRECRPGVLFAEQVEAAIGWGWLDAVFADLEAEKYACASAVLPACGVGAPHIRQRLWWVADAGGERRQQVGGSAPCDEGADGRRAQGNNFASGHGEDCGLADAGSSERQAWSSDGLGTGESGSRNGSIAHRGSNGGLADAEGDEWPALHSLAGSSGNGSQAQGVEQQPGRGGVRALEHAQGEQVGVPRRARLAGSALGELGHADDTRPQGRLVRRDGAGQRPAGAAGMADELADAQTLGRGEGRTGDADGPQVQPGGPRHAFWDDLIWLPCRDGRARPTQPGLQPLAHGVPGRVGKLRAAGNAIVAPLAAEFVAAFMECAP